MTPTSYHLPVKMKVQNNAGSALPFIQDYTFCREKLDLKSEADVIIM